jgi:hypothetical protein
MSMIYNSVVSEGGEYYEKDIFQCGERVVGNITRKMYYSVICEGWGILCERHGSVAREWWGIL